MDLRIGLKPCYPIVKGVEEIHRQKVLEIFEEDSDYEEFYGFSDSDIKPHSSSSLLFLREGACDAPAK